MMQTRKYANHYVQSLSKAQQRMGHMDVSPTRDRSNGFIEIRLSEEEPQKKFDQAKAEICPLSRRQLQDLQAVIAEVVEITPETNYIKILLPDGHGETAYCSYSGGLSTGDELYVTVRQRGRQRTIKILGLVPPDRKEVAHE